MPASRPKRTKRADHRLRIAFNGDERSLLANLAGPDGLAQAAFVRATVLKAMGEAPTGPITRGKRDKRAPRFKTYFTVAEQARLDALAKVHGLSRSEYVRMVVLAAAGDVPPPKKKTRATTHDELLHSLSLVAFQVKKVGTNINQLAKKANEGVVPIHRAEVQYFENQLQVVLAKATAAVEAMLA